MVTCDENNPTLLPNPIRPEELEPLNMSYNVYCPCNVSQPVSLESGSLDVGIKHLPYLKPNWRAESQNYQLSFFTL